MSRAAVLAVGSIIVGIGVVIVVWRDLRFGMEQRRRPTPHRTEVYGDVGPTWWRTLAEAMLPAVGVAVLVWWAWTVL